MSNKCQILKHLSLSEFSIRTSDFSLFCATADRIISLVADFVPVWCKLLWLTITLFATLKHPNTCSIDSECIIVYV